MRRCFVALALAMVLPLPVVAAEITVRPGETLSELAERHGVTVERLLKANGLSNANHVEAGRKLILPAGASTRASVSRPTSGGGRSAAGVVVVQPGETLSQIAEREGISLSRLMQLNGIAKADSVQAGSRLVLGGTGPSVRATARGNGASGGTVVVVRPGDTLSQIAEREGVSMNRLMQLNGIAKADDLQVGAKLVLGNVGSRVASAAPAAKPKSAPAPSSFPSNASTHRVQPGESLSLIAEGYGVPMSKLLALNGISDPNKVNVGTTLQLRGSVAAASRPANVAATSANAAAAPASKPTPKPTASQALPSRTANSSPSAATSRTTLASANAAPITSTAVSSRPAVAVKPSGVTTAATSSSTGPLTSGSSQPGGGSTVASATASAGTPNRSRPTATSSATATATTNGGASGSTISTSTAMASTSPARSSRPSVATASTRPTQVATAAASSRPAQASATPAKPDWRTYGPLQVDWANWQPMGGSLVAPTLNADGRSLYLAINCGARKLNATGQAGQWKTWDDPQTDFESQIVSDLCKSRG
ncbi:MAG: LysM peptidoglycan-binding domain-containing protein [Synechococcaceae cyanobacterium]|jgi:LysM repeat protein